MRLQVKKGIYCNKKSTSVNALIPLSIIIFLTVTGTDFLVKNN